MKEARIRAENIPPQHPICTLTITLPDYTGPLPTLRHSPIAHKEDKRPIKVKYSTALAMSPADTEIPIEFVARKIGADWPRLARTLQVGFDYFWHFIFNYVFRSPIRMCDRLNESLAAMEVLVRNQSPFSKSGFI